MIFDDDEAIDQQLKEMELCELNLKCSLSDFRSNSSLMPNMSSFDFFIQYMGLYLLKGDLINAKFLFKRLPQSIKDDSSMKSLWFIARLLWQQDTKKFFSTCTDLQSNLNNTDILYYIIERIRDRQLKIWIDLIKQAYSCVSIKFICDYFNLKFEELLNLFDSKSWYESPQKTFLIRVKGSEKNCTHQCVLDSEANLNMKLLSNLSELMCFMENH